MRADRLRMKAAPESATSTDTDVEERETLLVLLFSLLVYSCMGLYMTTERNVQVPHKPSFLAAVLLTLRHMGQDVPGGSSNGTGKLVEIPVDKVMTTLLFLFPAVGGLLFGGFLVLG